MIRVLLAALSTAVLLTACGNDPTRGSGKSALGTGGLLLSGFGKKAAPTVAPTAAQIGALIADTLAKTDKNVALVVIENRNAVATVVNVAQNQRILTWTTGDLRTLSTRNGRIVATRGLGFDLMSLTDAGANAQITARRTGQANVTLRFLNGENKTIAHSFTCTYARGRSETLSIAEISARTQRITETCSGAAHSFQNSYLVDARGRVLQARQWIGPENGYVLWQALRL